MVAFAGLALRLRSYVTLRSVTLAWLPSDSSFSLSRSAIACASGCPGPAVSSRVQPLPSRCPARSPPSGYSMNTVFW